MSAFFFLNNAATTEINTLSLHDDLPIWDDRRRHLSEREAASADRAGHGPSGRRAMTRSEEHTSELQSRQYLVCRLLLETKTMNTALPLTRMNSRLTNRRTHLSLLMFTYN